MLRKQTKLDKKPSREQAVIILLCFLGIAARFFVMALGHNFDFESYLIVGDIVNKGGNVYAETTRYNYGFIFFVLQGFGYNIAYHFPATLEEVYRIYIVSLLTLVDLGIMLYISSKYSYKPAFFFFLNPISIIITGYHNQFDNMAVLFALIALSFFSSDSSFSKRDTISIGLLTVSLIIKHIMAFYFIWLIINSTFSSFKKRIAYSCIPPTLFLISFLPFCATNINAQKGALNNVFFYRSYNNYPLLRGVLSIMNVPENAFFVIFIIAIVCVGLIVRDMQAEESYYIYLASLVALSSAIANQYLAIPLAVLVLYRKKAFLWLYTSVGTVYFILNGNELHLASRFINHFPRATGIITSLAEEGGVAVSIMTYVLVAFIITVIYEYKRYKISFLSGE